jgi:hypothetical protein
MTTNYVPYIIIAVVLMLGYGYLRYYLHSKKVKAYTAMAQKYGWHYVGADPALPQRYGGEPFGQGFSQQARHVLAGPYRGHNMIAFDYIYVTESGSGDNRSTTTHKYAVVSLSMPRRRPMLQLEREGLGRKLMGFVGVRDLQLESEEFNKAFLIKAENDRFAYDVLHPRMMQWMLADERTRYLPFRFEGDNLVTWADGTMKLEQLMYFLEYLCDVLDRVPAFVWKD